MTDIPELIQRLTDLDETLDYEVGHEDHDLAAIPEAIDALRATQWVPIADVPEEWKDGRHVNLIVIARSGKHITLTGASYKPNCPDNISPWRTSNYAVAHDRVTHAMLPPSPPTLKDNDHE